ncbi:hypothetical protein JCM18916_2632 [Cutibacterium acnes JCM 18916]|nr:hypothetical protein JCM18916_2632 [Cutibacterium acnes JCM 18916]
MRDAAAKTVNLGRGCRGLVEDGPLPHAASNTAATAAMAQVRSETLDISITW